MSLPDKYISVWKFKVGPALAAASNPRVPPAGSTLPAGTIIKRPAPSSIEKRNEWEFACFVYEIVQLFVAYNLLSNTARNTFLQTTYKTFFERPSVVPGDDDQTIGSQMAIAAIVVAPNLDATGKITSVLVEGVLTSEIGSPANYSSSSSSVTVP